jgi:uroporphyrinogen III methyltransferase/synthase
VLITRRWPDLAEALTAAGAQVIEVPAIAFAAPEDGAAFDGALQGIAVYQWIVFTSARAAETVAARMKELGLAMPGSMRVASIGPATRQAIRAAWPEAAVEVEPAAEFRGTALLDAFAGRDVEGHRMLLPVSDRAADTVADGLAALGASVDRVVAYRTVASGDGEWLLREVHKGPDAVVFASPSAVDAFLIAVGPLARHIPAATIGPTTADGARAAGLSVLAVAEPSTVEGLVEALARAWR